mgnify:CR=1 FL=1
MNMDFILYILLIMIFYDLSIHLIYLLGFEKFFLGRRINYWPEWSGRKYQRFWSGFWGLAFILLLIYIVFK